MSRATYFGGTTGGSGVLTGAQTAERSDFGWTFFWSRVDDEFLSWIFATIAVWYNNRPITWYFSPSIRRELTSNLGVSFNYSYQRQPAESSCTGLVCGHSLAEFRERRSRLQIPANTFGIGQIRMDTMSEFEERSSRQLTAGEYLVDSASTVLVDCCCRPCLGPIIGYGISLKLPSRYTSQTLVLVEEQKVPDTFVKPVITDLLDQRLATMQEQILSRSRLQPIVERFGLFADKRNLSIDDKIELTRKATEIKPVRPDFGCGGASRN